jgi:UPF0755 protein
VKKLLKALLVLVLLAGGTAGGYLYLRLAHLRQFAGEPFGGPESKLVNVPSGTGPRGAANLLAQASVVKSADDFYQLIRKEGAGPRLRAGEYEFKGPLTPADVLDRLVEGKVKSYRFTVPEGLRAEEIIPLLAASELKLDAGKLVTLLEDKAFLRSQGVPADTAEGFLFPDTYTFTRPFSEEAVVKKMIARTLEEYRKADQERDPAIKLTLLETMTLASIIEKETGAPDERPRISCVFHNRLRKPMPLQTDPTVIYAMRLLRGFYSKNITRKDLTTPHPYNTYVVSGLPPGPIASPGAAAIVAALKPLTCNDLFFVSRNDGTHVFCPDLACHNQAVNRFQVQYFRNKRRGD